MPESSPKRLGPMGSELTRRSQMFNRQRLAIGAALLLLAGAAVYGFVHIGGARQGHSDVSSQSRKGLQRYTPSQAEWASLSIEPGTKGTLRAQNRHEAK